MYLPELSRKICLQINFELFQLFNFEDSYLGEQLIQGCVRKCSYKVQECKTLSDGKERNKEVEIVETQSSPHQVETLWPKGTYAIPGDSIRKPLVKNGINVKRFPGCKADHMFST